MNKIDNQTLKYWLETSSEIVFSVYYSNRGNATLYFNGSQSKSFSIGGCGYDKASSLFGDFFNTFFDTKKLLSRKSIKSEYGNQHGELSLGVGMETHENILNKLKGFGLERITETRDSTVYKLTYKKELLK